MKNPATPSYFNSGESEERGRLRKAERHVHEGAFSRAARLLTSSGLAPDTDDTQQKLGKKHPDPFESCVTPVATDSAAISLCHEVILKALKTTPRGSAPAPSGMRFEHLKPCLDSRDLCDLLCAVVQSVVSGNPSSEIGQALAASHLIGLAKENGDVRPIAVGEYGSHSSPCAVWCRYFSGVGTGGSPDPG